MAKRQTYCHSIEYIKYKKRARKELNQSSNRKRNKYCLKLKSCILYYLEL
jgi:hypothetical protein